VKLRKGDIKGFRGAPVLWPVPFSTKSHFIFSENGRGKSTLADALEFLTSGDLVAYHREGCEIDAAVNLDGDGVARVEAALRDPEGHLRRAIVSGRPGALESKPGLDPGPIPILHQATISAFMRRTSGEKRQALLELLDLDALTSSGRPFARRVATPKSGGPRPSSRTARRRRRSWRSWTVPI
jgi:hypothetical protein